MRARCCELPASRSGQRLQADRPPPNWQDQLSN